MAFVPAETTKAQVDVDLVVIIHRGKLLCQQQQGWKPLSPASLAYADEIAHQHYLGHLDGQHCFAWFFNTPTEPHIAGFEWCSLRSQLGLISDELFQLAGRALQITLWYRNHQFCGVCGSPTRVSTTDRSLICGRCEARFYPRISPCVIGLIKRGRQCLLARSARHPEGVFSTLAGFIEAGETAEQAFAREVKEEVGVEVENIAYFGSQPWPFPGQLMIGFTAEYLTGDIQVDGVEIIEARWFSVGKLPIIPPAETISGRIIRRFVEQLNG